MTGRVLMLAVPRMLEGVTWASVTYGDLATLEEKLKADPKQFESENA